MGFLRSMKKTGIQVARKNKAGAFLLALLLITIFITPLPGQDPAAPYGNPPVASAVGVESAPEIDGNVIDDPAWGPALPLVDFWQSTPNEGQPATERTEVRVIYTRDTLFFGVICYDSSPNQIIASDSRRDSPLENSDAFQIILDTYLDHQNGFVFGTNPAGIEYDGQVTREGEGEARKRNRQQAGSGGGFNLNWDGSWRVKAMVGEFGWSAEFAIPFRTIRFKAGKDVVWGLNFERNIRRKYETSYWAPLPRQFKFYKLSLAGTLEGLDVEEQGVFQVTPYALGEVRYTGESERTNWLGAGGIDLIKYNLTPSLTFDATVNTDFAQVEVDDLQMNLDRFALFYPEKRPFFLENAGIFSVGLPGEVELFYSRRIGLDPSGEQVSIQGGARLTGKLGGHTNIGLLNMQTSELGGIAPSSNYSVVRVNQDLPNRSSLGGMVVNRESIGNMDEFTDSNEFNRTYAVDGQLGIGANSNVAGYFAGTSSPEVDEGAHSFNLRSEHNGDKWLLRGGYTEVGEGFNPEVGFLSRGAYRKANGHILYTYRPADLWKFQEFRPHITYEGYWDFDGYHETNYLHMDNSFVMKDGTTGNTVLNLTKEGVKEPFEIFPGVVVPVGVYNHKVVELAYRGNEGARLSASFVSTIGGFFGGDRIALQPGVKARLGEKLTSEFSWNRNDVNLPWGDFVANLGSLRVSYSFNPKVFIQSLLQYNNASGNWSSNVRFGWLQKGNAGLYVVYNDTRGLEGWGIRGDRSLIVKISRMFDLM